MIVETSEVRVQLLSEFLKTPHGKLEALAPIHQRVLDADPMFYAHLMAWQWKRSEVRDHQLLAVAHMLTAPNEFSVMREAGWKMFQGLPVHLAVKTAEYIRKTLRRKNVRMVKSAVATYLRTLEGNFHTFDNAAVRNADGLTYLYAAYRIKPALIAKQFLRMKDLLTGLELTPPVGSRTWAMSELQRLKGDEEAQARLIVKHNLPYPVVAAAGLGKSPMIVAALVAVMTPSEVVNHQKMMTDNGVMKNPGLAAIVNEKIVAAGRDKRVSALKIDTAIKNSGVSTETAAKLSAASDARASLSAKIKLPTALFVDISASMERAIQMTTDAVAPMISQATTAGFWAYVFNVGAQEMKARGTSKSDWQAAFQLVRAHGGTNIGAPFTLMIKNKVKVDQVVIITDMDENNQHDFTARYREYVVAMGISPKVVVVGVGALNSSTLPKWQAAGIDASMLMFNGDQYSVSNLLNALSAPGFDDLVTEILSMPLPTRAV